MMCLHYFLKACLKTLSEAKFMKLEVIKKCEDMCDDIVICDNCEDEVCEEVCEEVQHQCLTICAEHLESLAT